MQEEHRQAIQNNFGSLVEQTDLDLIVSVLFEKGVFSEPMIEPYRDTNRDVRTRKRQLYRDIERRGPKAFDNLLEALTETGHWDLVRALDPNSVLHPHRNIEPGLSRVASTSSNFVSISQSKENKPPKKEPVDHQQSTSNAPYPPDFSKPDDVSAVIPRFHVVKSTKFHTKSESGNIDLYPTRSRCRGVLIAFSFIEFKNNIEKYRKGAEVDCTNLKYLFDEIGFKTVLYNNLDKAETEATLKALKNNPFISSAECVFVVVSSHGYERGNSSDTDVRCSDGQLISYQAIVQHFDQQHLARLQGKPKVFIFQTCRGSAEDIGHPPAHMAPPAPARRARVERDGATRARSPAPPPLAATGGLQRQYSDILIAHSTVPGFVSKRDPEKGSWYIQALCEVFAAQAHQHHVLELFTLVDIKLRQFGLQTSSVDNWGFNKRLYLHPGLFED